MLKMVLDPMGGVAITNDGNAILRVCTFVVIIDIALLSFLLAHSFCLYVNACTCLHCLINSKMHLCIKNRLFIKLLSV